MKKTLCESRFLVNLTPREPLLVKRDKVERINRRDYAVCFEAFNPRTVTQSPCIPGSSLKGVMRNYAEKILRSFDEHYACDPLREEASCSGRVQALKESHLAMSIVDVFKNLCPACRLFGCTEYAGKVEIDDAFPADTAGYVTQTGIAIDRFTGGVKSGAMYNRKPLYQFTLSTVISIKNFELWHLGLLALVLRDMGCGIVKIGSGTRTGYGGIGVDVSAIELSYIRAVYRRTLNGQRISGVSALLSEDERRLYGIKSEEPIRLNKFSESGTDDLSVWLRYVLQKDRDDIDGFFEKCVSDYLVASLETGFGREEGV